MSENFEMPKPTFQTSEGKDAHFDGKVAKAEAEIKRLEEESERPTAEDLDRDVLAKAEEVFNKKEE